MPRSRAAGPQPSLEQSPRCFPAQAGREELTSAREPRPPAGHPSAPSRGTLGLCRKDGEAGGFGAAGGGVGKDCFMGRGLLGGDGDGFELGRQRLPHTADVPSATERILQERLILSHELPQRHEHAVR